MPQPWGVREFFVFFLVSLVFWLTLLGFSYYNNPRIQGGLDAAQEVVELAIAASIPCAFVILAAQPVFMPS